MVGQARFSNIIKLDLSFLRVYLTSNGLISFLSLRSAPAQNMPGAWLFIMTTFASTWSEQASSSYYKSNLLKAFLYFSLFKLNTTTPWSSFSMRRCLSVAVVVKNLRANFSIFNKT
jgi:hypothetical protein